MIGGRRAWQAGVLAAALVGGEARGDTDVGDHAGAAGAAAGAGKRVVVLADTRNTVHEAVAEELRLKLHRSHRGAAFEVRWAGDGRERREVGAQVGRSAPDVAVVLGPAMIDDALGSLPATTARLYGDVGEHDARLDRLRAQGLAGVVDLCPAESLLRLALRLTPRAREVVWSKPGDTRRAALEPALTAAARSLGVSVAGGGEGAARLLFVLPSEAFDWPRPPYGPARGAGAMGPPGAPLVACSQTAFERGATAAFVSEPEEVGEALARQVAAALDGKRPVDERIEGATVLLDPGAACASGATVDAVLLDRSVTPGRARMVCATPPRSRAGWAALAGLGALVAAAAFAARSWLVRRGSAAVDLLAGQHEVGR